jgi:hypothetical protein
MDTLIGLILPVPLPKQVALAAAIADVPRGHDGLHKYPGTLGIVLWMPMMAGTLAT